MGDNDVKHVYSGGRGVHVSGQCTRQYTYKV